MIESFGVSQKDVPYWAGIIGAIFSLSQSLTAVPWGRAADIFGRKPAILLGLTSTMICFIIWGFSTSLAMAVTVRAIQGGGNGNVGIIRTMVAELVVEKELQPKAFSIMPLVWSLGSIFGPSFGGLFSRPAEQWPGLFGNSDLLKRFPFLLPNLVACVFFLISVVTGALFLEETLDVKKHKRDLGLVIGEKLTQPFRKTKKPSSRGRRHSFVDDEATAPLLSPSGQVRESSGAASPRNAPPSNAEVFTSQTIINLVSYTGLALHAVAADQALPVFLSYPRPDFSDPNSIRLPLSFTGGFGLAPEKIGLILTIYGVACGFIQFFVFPPVCNRLGVLNCFKVVAIIFPLIYFLLPYTSLIQHTQLRYAALMGLMLVKGFTGIFGFPCTTIMLTNSASSLRILGTLNGFATMFSGLGRAAGPAATGGAFSWGVKHGYVIAPWWMLGCIAILAAIPAWFIVEGEGPNRALEVDTDEELEASQIDQGVTELLDDTFVLDDEDDTAAGDFADSPISPVPGMNHEAFGSGTNDIPSPEESEDELPDMPLSPTKNHSGLHAAVRQMRLRRMSSDGVDLERSRTGAQHGEEGQPR
jgi:MFS family permease